MVKLVTEQDLAKAFDALLAARKELAEAKAEGQPPAPEVPKVLGSVAELQQFVESFAAWDKAHAAKIEQIRGLSLGLAAAEKRVMDLVPAGVWVRHQGMGIGVSRNPNGTNPQLHVREWGDRLPLKGAN